MPGAPLKIQGLPFPSVNCGEHPCDSQSLPFTKAPSRLCNVEGSLIIIDLTLLIFDCHIISSTGAFILVSSSANMSFLTKSFCKVPDESVQSSESNCPRLTWRHCQRNDPDILNIPDHISTVLRRRREAGTVRNPPAVPFGGQRYQPWFGLGNIERWPLESNGR